MDVTSDLFFGKVFVENPVLEIVLPFKWVSMYIFLRMVFFGWVFCSQSFDSNGRSLEVGRYAPAV